MEAAARRANTLEPAATATEDVADVEVDAAQ
jgi:hypothetical protein